LLAFSPVDYKMLKGMFPDKRPSPKGWGTDVSGTIEAVGSSVTRFKVGDAVYADAIMHSPMAEFCLIPASKVSAKPGNMDSAQATTIPLAGLTALQALRDHGKMKAGAKVCIFGGSGGVGTLAIQIAKALGASHVATTSTNEELCTSLGADVVVNYRNADVGEVLKGQDFDVVFDTVGGVNHWLAAKKIIARRGKFVTIAGDGGSMAKTMGAAVWRMFLSNFGGTSYGIFLTKNGHADLDVLTGMIQENKITATIDEPQYKFSDEGIKDMLTKLMSGRTKGKLVMTM
jgi:NADPH:quinone reductase-like Zn-dependent oxidoreductase